ncbi:MAG: hypothetical protein ABSF67_00795 [Roseiarcus sp.]|jgi:hypothetical protein
MPVISTYERLVAKHHLAALLAEGDLQVTASGDIAQTRDGDLKWGEDRCNAMHRLVMRWCFNVPTLETLFSLILKESERKRQAETERESAANIAFARAEPDPDEVAKFHALGEQIGAAEFGGAACAGAIVVVLNNLLLRYKADLKAADPKWEKITPQFGGYSFGEVVSAAANNFRHHDEWASTRAPNAQQMKSIAVIEGVLGHRMASAITVPWRRNACVELVAVVGGSDFETLERRFFEFAKSICS